MLGHTSRAQARRFFWCFLLLGSASLPAQAFNYLVNPIRIEMGPKQRSTTALVSSNSKRPVLLRVKAHRWSKRDGEDHLEASSNLIVTPPLLRLEPGQKQTVRLGLISARAPGSPEQQFRIEFEEVDGGSVDVSAPEPEPGEKPKVAMQINLLTNISIPLILRGDSAVKSLAAKARWAPTEEPTTPVTISPPEAAQEAAKAKLWVEVSNNGTATQQLAKLSLKTAEGLDYGEPGGFIYVLPGQMSRIVFNVPVGVLPSGLRLNYRENSADSSLPLNLTSP